MQTENIIKKAYGIVTYLVTKLGVIDAFLVFDKEADGEYFFSASESVKKLITNHFIKYPENSQNLGFSSRQDENKQWCFSCKDLLLLLRILDQEANEKKHVMIFRGKTSILNELTRITNDAIFAGLLCVPLKQFCTNAFYKNGKFYAKIKIYGRNGVVITYEGSSPEEVIAALNTEFLPNISSFLASAKERKRDNRRAAMAKRRR